MPFIGELEFKRSKDDTESFAGRPFYVLTKPLAFADKRAKTQYTVSCPKGFKTDFASIPEYFIFLDPKDPKWQRAAVIHDQACRLSRATTELTMREADAFLYYGMLECGSSKFLAWTFWFWVRAKHVLQGEA